jgi:hypothetical protein
MAWLNRLRARRAGVSPPAAKAGVGNEPVIAAVNRCATQKISATPELAGRHISVGG